MTVDLILDHYAKSIVRQLSLRRILFVQATANIEEVDGSLLRTIRTELESTIALPLEIVAPQNTFIDSQANARVIVLTRLDAIADKENSAWLANMRPTFTAAVENGSLLLIYSTVPRLRLFTTAGSLVSMDCAYYRPIKIQEELLTEFLGEIPQKEQDGIRDWSRLQPSLLRRFAAISKLRESNTKKLKLSNTALIEIATECFAQLGPEIATWLEDWAYAYQGQPAARIDVPDDILEALISAGMAEINEPDKQVQLFPGPAHKLYISALRDYLDSVTKPSAKWPDLVKSLFEIERMIRFAVKIEYISNHDGDWRTHLPDGPLRKAISRACIDIPLYRSSEMSNNPLEWMTISELALTTDLLCENFGTVAGIDARVWRSLFQQIEPIRNRVAHMRLMKYGDLDIVRRWIRELRMRAPSSFPRN